ncbi:hypothetical protein [Coraliomargarita akajimensis]|uniref:Uncharacterized protein n=1 Tax=Coraliomargarita akajimensis (strain DSM 45221 / IAM 15411 / JCM 23193 / KCTC 12865 / 04OKA010-24) TaxID=583355 RepID=D5ENS7_CORAD|nr:hypothetical protein [Coraliomargarita akajimensis]ADE53586.1 hypothetical protein Caka_0561 [Coraliomargarita akajimensis DSM 45221]
MSTLDKAVEKLPDLHFDWYARLIPGLAGLIAYASTESEGVREQLSDNLLLSIGLAYLIGHFAQPLASAITKVIEKKSGREADWNHYRGSAEAIPLLLSKVSKAHAEAVSMMSSSIIILAVFIYRIVDTMQAEWLLVFCSCILFIFGIERCRARARKINNLPIDEPRT